MQSRCRASALRRTTPLWLSFLRPPRYSFTPGQATDVALDQDGWRDEKRPFTFTSDPDATELEFTIKAYPDHEGVTDRISKLLAGERVLIGEPWGAIRDVGPGTFIAAGAGITPFIPILRARAGKGELEGCRLIYANKTPDDIILQHEWEEMTDLDTTFVVEEGDGVLHEGQIDGALLESKLGDFSGRFYLCGPPPMMDAVRDLLTERGVSSDRIVEEDL